VSPVHNSHSGGSNNGPLSNHHSSRQLSSSPLSAGGPVQMMGHMGHPLSPPHVSTPSSMAGMVGMPPRMAQNLSHLPPHGLGLLNSFMHHASPLDLMAAAHHHVPPRSYNSPPPISSSDPTANECKLVDYRGQKVAAFMIQGETMLCLPQAFELFLKHLVGGLHTVYTKLKRLDIVPLVCNVEQVRILRGLGAIQPGVNRCKLLSCKDFDVLYRDCTTASNSLLSHSSRPGRPPKRGPVGLSMPTSHMPHHAQLKKHRLDNGEFVYENGHLNDLPRLDKSPLLANGYNAPPTHLNHIPFMQMNPHPAAGGHPLMSPGVNPHGIQRPDGSIIKGQNIPGMEAIARCVVSHHTGIWENCRAAYEDIVKHLERLREERGDDRTPNVDHKPRDLSSQGSGKWYQKGSVVPPDSSRGGRNPHSPNGQSPALNLSKSGVGDHGGGGASGGGGGGIGGGGAGSGSGAQSERSNPISPEPSVHEEDENMSEANISDTEEPNDKDEGRYSTTIACACTRMRCSPGATHTSLLLLHLPNTDISDCDRDLHSPVPAVMPVPPDMEAHRQQALNYSSLAASVAVGAVPTGQDPSISSTETLLRNIQGLLKVAADNARQQERQTSYEKAELKMDVIREREVKDSFERQLADEKRLRALYQKRFKKERRLRMQIQERLDGERKRRGRDKGQEREREPLHHQQSSSSSSVDRNHREHRSTIEESLRAGDRHRVEVERERRASSSERYSKEDSPAPNLSSSSRPSQEVSPSQPPLSEGKSWNYPGLDIMATGAFWQNYSESLAQELELERKARQQAAEGEVKGPLQDRSNYYKNSVLYTSAT
ncbi:AGAP007935-PA, partial [Anopheles gambiae str. PEST]